MPAQMVRLLLPTMKYFSKNCLTSIVPDILMLPPLKLILNNISNILG